MTTPRFNKIQSTFNLELRNRITQYFKENQISPTGNTKLYFKAIILILTFIAVYIHLIIFTPSLLIALSECIVLGFLTSFIGFNIMHDGSHGSFSQSTFINSIAGMSMNFLGSNVHFWNTKHNVIHHTFTNIDEIDDDIDVKPFLRLSPTQEYHFFHKFQHVYFLAAYSIFFLFWIFYTDYVKYFTRKIGDYPMPPFNVKTHISFWAFKLIHAVLFIVLPIIQFGFLNWLMGFLLYTVATGLVLAIVFQMAHTVDGTEFPIINEHNSLEDEWMIHQLKTTANFSTKNPILSWFVGGLNFQIEHHLFPKISHVHYPAISRIVKKTCQEFNVQYIEFPSIFDAFLSHYRHLKFLGQNA